MLEQKELDNLVAMSLAVVEKCAQDDLRQWVGEYEILDFSSAGADLTNKLSQICKHYGLKGITLPSGLILTPPP